MAPVSQCLLGQPLGKPVFFGLVSHLNPEVVEGTGVFEGSLARVWEGWEGLSAETMAPH